MSDLLRYPVIEAGVTLEPTEDPRTRKVMYHDGYIGNLLLHDGNFKLELGPSVPLDLKVAQSILVKAMLDVTIQNQHAIDGRPSGF